MINSPQESWFLGLTTCLTALWEDVNLSFSGPELGQVPSPSSPHLRTKSVLDLCWSVFEFIARKLKLKSVSQVLQ